MNRSAPRPVFLVGFMGCGKSTVGRALAERTGAPFLDCDAEIERREGRSIADLLGDRGERWFREREWSLLREIGVCTGIVATGGGMFASARPRRWMKSTGWTVWLDVPLDLCRQRIGVGAGRPLWDDSDRVALRALFERRRAAYALAHLREDASGVADEVVLRLQGRIPFVFR